MLRDESLCLMPLLIFSSFESIRYVSFFNTIERSLMMCLLYDYLFKWLPLFL